MAKKTRRRIPLAERFWKKVDKRGPDECWPWTASKNEHGYGKIYLVEINKPIKASRASWILAHGEDVPAGLVVCHRCDNPPCVNPAHLFVASQDENWLDMRRKNRAKHPPRLQGTRHHQAKLSNADVLAIRADQRIKRLIAADFGVCVGTVKQIKAHKIWTHI